MYGWERLQAAEENFFLSFVVSCFLVDDFGHEGLDFKYQLFIRSSPCVGAEVHGMHAGGC